MNELNADDKETLVEALKVLEAVRISMAAPSPEAGMFHIKAAYAVYRSVSPEYRTKSPIEGFDPK